MNNEIAFAAIFFSTPGQMVANAIALVGWDNLGTNFAAHAPCAPRPVAPIEDFEFDPAEWAARDR